MATIKDRMKQIEEETTPLECVNDIIESLEMLYCEEDRLPKELSKFAGSLHVALKQARLLKIKLK